VKNTSSFANSKLVVALAATILALAALTGCASSPEETEASSLQQVDGRAISATEQELVLRTADQEYTFQIRPEDVAAIDPGHIQSHSGVESIGFRVFYRNIDGVDYVVSVEEIDGSTLGFD
jgi:hypothetical protein